jgi:hypothetical protein
MVSSPNRDDKSSSKPPLQPELRTMLSDSSTNSDHAAKTTAPRKSSFSHEEYKHYIYASWLNKASRIEEDNFGFRSGTTSRAQSPHPGATSAEVENQEERVRQNLEHAASIDEKFAMLKESEAAES